MTANVQAAGTGNAQRRNWLAAAVILLTAFALFLFYGTLKSKVDLARGGTLMDVSLSTHREAHEALYKQVLKSAPLPEGTALDPNEWIAELQTFLRNRGLELETLTPMTEKGRSGTPQTKLSLSAQGNVLDTVRFLYDLAEAKDRVYVERMSLTLMPEMRERIRIEMVLVQD
jgi:hypothetical protein